MQSMTGFGRGAAASDNIQVTCELKSVNHKSLDVKVRLPRDFIALEHDVTVPVRKALARGRIDVSIAVSHRASGEGAVHFNHEAFDGVWAQLLATAARTEGVSPTATLGDILRVPAFIVQSEGSTVTDEDKRAVLDAVQAGLEELVRARAVEGAGLLEVLETHLARCERLKDGIAGRAAGAPERAKERLEARLATLDVDVDPSRLAQEVALLAERVDVDEEINRLGLHFEHFRSLMNEEGSVGRKLDFLCQELFRETNTIGSKCADAEIAHQVVELKAEVERIREQVQNVE